MLKVLTYVDGKLTVICGDKGDLSVAADKPSFMSKASAWYYEPTQSRYMDLNGVPNQMTEEDILSSEAFIDAYSFSQSEGSVPADVTEPTFAVNHLGYYLGVKFLADGEVAVDSAPVDSSKQYWDFATSAWVEGLTVSEDTRLVAYSGVSYMTGCVFTPISNFDKDICTDVQIYDFNTKSFTVDIPLLKKKKTEKMFQAFNDDFANIAGDFGKVPSYETSSYWLQIQEAEIVVSGGQNPTPFLSTLLTARGVEGETLSTLATLILSKAYAYKTAFGAMLGKYQNRIKAIAKAITVEEIKAVSW